MIPEKGTWPRWHPNRFAAPCASPPFEGGVPCFLNTFAPGPGVRTKHENNTKPNYGRARWRAAKQRQGGKRKD
eukprot:2526964-Prymnesium_polylepis.1